MQSPELILTELICAYPDLSPLRGELLAAHRLFLQCYDRGGMVLCCGNGGSAADADHVVGELMKSFRLERPLPAETVRRLSSSPGGRELAASLQSALPAVSLVGQTALLSACANDVSPDLVYAQQVLGYGAHWPILLLALSTSGSSVNVVRAAQVARCLGMPTVAITGEAGGMLAELSTVCLRMPARETYRVQEYTLPVYHALCAMAEAHYFAPCPTGRD